MRAYGYNGYKIFGDGRDAFGDPRVPRTYEEVVADRESRDAAAAARVGGDGDKRREVPHFIPVELADIALQGVLAGEAAEQLTVAGLPEAE